MLGKVDKRVDDGFGYDFSHNCYHPCMYSVGIIDPVKVTKTALTNAVSAASTLLNTNHAIIQVE